MATLAELAKVKAILAEASVTLAENLQPKEVMWHLEANKALRMDQEQSINAETNETDKVHKLIDLFFTKSVADYEQFRKILEEQRPDLYHYLLSVEQEHNFRPESGKETVAELFNKARIGDLRKIKEILPKTFIKFRGKLSPKDILQELSAMGALKESEVETINTEKCSEDQVKAMLNKFHRKSASDYERLREALAKVQPEMYPELESIEKEHNFQPHNKIERPVVSLIRGRHVMISYETEAKERMVKLKDELTKCGVKIVMDEDQHGDDLYQRRATSIEDADTILLCFSKKYTTDDVCPKEAEYATFLDKPIIPMQFDDHKPTGLLALMMNAQESYDVETEETLMENLPKIKQALENAKKKHTTTADSKYAPSEPLTDKDCELINMISAKIKPHYRNFCNMAVCPWKPGKNLDPDKVFVPMTIDIKVEGATAVKKHLNSYQDILKHSQDKTRFLLAGDPGQGKSVLCAKIAHDWCRDTCKNALSPLKHIKLLFILQLGKMDHTSNIEDAICEQLLTKRDAKKVDKDQLVDVIYKLGQSVMVVFDGVDESPTDLFEQKPYGNVLEIMRSEDMKDCLVVVTTRPWRKDDVNKFAGRGGAYEQLELQRMNKSDVETLVDKYFNQNDSSEATIWGNALLKQIENNKLVVDTSTPLLVVLLCWYFAETKGQRDIPVKISELYENIINIMYETTQCQIEKDELIANRLGQIAVSGLQAHSTKIVFSKEEIESVSGAEGLEQACNMGIVCKKGNDYQFFHKSGQEFCAGVFLAVKHQDKLSEYLSQINTVRDAQNLGMVLKFAAAKNIEAADQIVERLVSIFCSDEKCQKYYEEKEIKNEDGDTPRVPVLQFDESLTVQQFIELCLECNYEANAESRYTGTLGKLFELPASVRDSRTESEDDRARRVMAYGDDDGQRVMLYGVAAKTAITLGYFMQHSGARITRVDLTPAAHVTDDSTDAAAYGELGPASEVYEKTRSSMLDLGTRQLEDICDKFIASHPEMNEAWKGMRTEWVGAIERARSEEKKEEYQGDHLDSLAQLASYISLVQNSPIMPSMLDTDLSPVVQSLPHTDIRWLDLDVGYYAMMRGDVITRLVSVIAKCAKSLRLLFANWLDHWDMQQKRDLCQAIRGMINLTELYLYGIELDRDCQRHLVTSLEELSGQETSSLKVLDLRRTRLDKDILYGILAVCKKMGTVEILRLHKDDLPDGVTRADLEEKYDFVKF